MNDSKFLRRGLFCCFGFFGLLFSLVAFLFLINRIQSAFQKNTTYFPIIKWTTKGKNKWYGLSRRNAIQNSKAQLETESSGLLACVAKQLYLLVRLLLLLSFSGYPVNASDIETCTTLSAQLPTAEEWQMFAAEGQIQTSDKRN